MRPVAMTGLPIHMYHATHCVSTQLSLDKSVLAYSILECSYGSAVELDMVLSDAPDDELVLMVDGGGSRESGAAEKLVRGALFELTTNRKWHS